MWRRRVISTKKRNINLDMIRVIAVFSVLSVHFFLHNGFYEEIVVGKRLFFMGTMRNCKFRPTGVNISFETV